MGVGDHKIFKFSCKVIKKCLIFLNRCIESPVSHATIYSLNGKIQHNFSMIRDQDTANRTRQDPVQREPRHQKIINSSMISMGSRKKGECVISSMKSSPNIHIS